MAPINLLRAAEIKRLALCKVGANRQRVFLLKSGEGEETAVAAVAQLVKEPGDDWRVAYVPVAVPGAQENPGMFGDQDSLDEWESVEEIRKAAHSFMANGAQVVGKHFDPLQAEGVKLVENAVALADFEVGDATIKEGTWYVGLEFDDAQRQLVNKGEIDAVSIEGTAERIAKGRLERVPGEQNWVDRVGGFPAGNWIERAAVHLHEEKGMTISHAIATAVNAAKKLCATGDLNWPGVQQARPEHQADACKGVAEWEAMKARAHAQGLAKSVAETEALIAKGDTLEPMDEESKGLLRRIAKAIGARPDEDADFEGTDYDADYIAKREFTPSKRKELSGTGAAMPHGGFPIESCGDVSNAVQAIGRARNPEAARRHIISRAKTLGCLAQLPEGWKTALAKGLDEEGGSVSDVDLAERVEKLEGTLTKQGETLAELTGEEGHIAKINSTLEEIAKRLPEKPEDEKLTPEKLAEKIEGVGEKQGEIDKELQTLAKSVDQLAEGKQSETEPEREREALAKSNGAERGILFEYED